MDCVISSDDLMTESCNVFTVSTIRHNGFTYLLHTHTYTHNTHNHFTALWTLSGTTRVSWYQKVHFATFWIFWSKMKITQADAPTIWMDCHPIQTNWCPYLLAELLTILVKSIAIFNTNTRSKKYCQYQYQ